MSSEKHSSTAIDLMNHLIQYAETVHGVINILDVFDDIISHWL